MNSAGPTTRSLTTSNYDDEDDVEILKSLVYMCVEKKIKSYKTIDSWIDETDGFIT